MSSSMPLEALICLVEPLILYERERERGKFCLRAFCFWKELKHRRKHITLSRCHWNKFSFVGDYLHLISLNMN